MSRRPGSRIAPSLLSILITFASPPDRATAVPVVDLSWGACSPIVPAMQPAGGETVFSMFVSVTGLADTHTAYSAEVFLAGELACGASAATPDAWRFDAGGCQGRTLGPISLESKDAACPPLGPPNALAIIDFSRIDDFRVGPVGAMRLFVAAGYPQSPRTADPGVRYQLLRMDFHHGASVSGSGTPGQSCGGYEVPICIALYSGVANFLGGEDCDWLRETGRLVYADAARKEVPFTTGQDVLSFGLEPGSAFSCFEAVPAQGSTWGAIKAQYR